MKLGKHSVDPKRRANVRLSQIHPALPTPPAVVLRSVDFKGVWGMMGNDLLGDCTCAALGHAEQTVTASCVGLEQFSASTAQVEDLYSKACGYVPGDPATDQGGDEVAVLNFVRKNGLFGTDQLIGYADTNPRDIEHVKQGIAFYGGAYIGLMLPNSVVNGDLLSPAWAGRTDPGNPYNGHAIWVMDYDDWGLTGITWGVKKRLSWDFWLRYCDETHILLFRNWLAQYGNLDVASAAMENALQAVAS